MRPPFKPKDLFEYEQAPPERKFGIENARAEPPNPDYFNHEAEIPYGVTTDHIRQAMEDWIDVLDSFNDTLTDKEQPRFEIFLQPASFSGSVGEFIITRLPEYCPTITQNTYPNGHPDMVPTGEFPYNSVKHSTIGIEVKSSKNRGSWKGHNQENVWLLGFVFEANSANCVQQAMKKGDDPITKPFRFTEVLGAQLVEDDWNFSGRHDTSKATITATIKPSGYEKLHDNWIYRVPELEDDYEKKKESFDNLFGEE